MSPGDGLRPSPPPLLRSIGHPPPSASSLCSSGRKVREPALDASTDGRAAIRPNAVAPESADPRRPLTPAADSRVSNCTRTRMINKLFPSTAAALQGVRDGSTVMIGGFGGAGQPNELIDAL